MITADYNACILPFPAVEDKIWGPDDLLGLEDRAGIEQAVVITAPTLWPDNESLAAAIKGYDRLIGSAIINPQFGEKAVAELERCVTQFGFKGMKFMSTFHGFLIHGPLVDPVMRKARELGIPVTIHSGSWNVYPLQIAVLADRYPEVPIIMEHAGYRWFVPDAIAAAQRCPNIYLGLSVLASEAAMIGDIFKAVGPQRMLFGSDAPSCYPDLAAEAIRRARLGQEAEEWIFGGTLARLYKLD